MLHGNRMTIWAVAALGLLIAIPLAARAQETNHEAKFFVLGEKYPKGLSDFQAFDLFRTVKGHGKVKLDGWVITNLEDPNNSTVDMRSVRIRGKRLAFTTKPRAGVVFTFSGRFLKTGDFAPYFNKRVPVIEGTVLKVRHGRKVVEGKMRFKCGTSG